MCNQLERKTLQSPIAGSRDIRTTEKTAGSITLEASIFLTVFILFYMALMDLVQIARAQVILQYSINEVAKEVSQCSYILTKTGIVEKRMATSSTANQFKGQTADLVNAVKELGNTLTEGGDIVGAAEHAGNLAYDYFSDTDELASNILSLIKSSGANIASNYVIQELVESNVKKQLEGMTTKDVDTYLEDLGIEGGFDSLDFSRSNWCQTSSGRMPDLEVTVVYQIHFNLGFIELEPRTFKLTAKTALW